MSPLITKSCQTKQEVLSTSVISVIYLFISLWHCTQSHALAKFERSAAQDQLCSKKWIALAQWHLTFMSAHRDAVISAGCCFPYGCHKTMILWAQNISFQSVILIKVWHSSRFGTSQQKITAKLSRLKCVVTSWYVWKKKITALNGKSM